jgi:HrpA-like RNA helicase
MARFPLPPRLSKALVVAKDFGSVEWMCALVSMLTNGGHGVFVRAKEFKKQAALKKLELTHELGDHFTQVHVTFQKQSFIFLKLLL